MVGISHQATILHNHRIQRCRAALPGNFPGCTRPLTATRLCTSMILKCYSTCEISKSTKVPASAAGASNSLMMQYYWTMVQPPAVHKRDQTHQTMQASLTRSCSGTGNTAGSGVSARAKKKGRGEQGSAQKKGRQHELRMAPM